MSEGCTLALDQGTHASRALLFDSRGRLLRQASRPVALHAPGNGRVEQDPAEILASLQGALDTVLRHRDGLPAPVGQVGLATQRASVLAWERSSGQALSPVLSWRDTRNAAQVAALADAAGEIARRTGLRLSAHYGASKLAWLLLQQPGLRRAQERGDLVIGPLAAFVLQHLTGRPATLDEANAGRTLLWNLAERRWDPWLQARFAVPEDLLPAVQPVRSDYGMLVGYRLPVTAVNGDQGAALHGWGAPSPDALAVNLGTGAFVMRPLGGPAGERHRPADGLLLSLVDSDRETFGLAGEGTVHGAGAALQWLAARMRPLDPLRMLEPALSRVQDPPVFRNTVGGLGSPWWRAGPAPCFPGHPVGELDPLAATAAVAESLLFLVHTNLQLLCSGGPGVRSIRASGGLARADVLCQRLADLSGLPVHRPPAIEATARGIAWLAAGRPTTWQRPGDATRFEPRPDAALQARYQRFVKALEADSRPAAENADPG